MRKPCVVAGVVLAITLTLSGVTWAGGNTSPETMSFVIGKSSYSVGGIVHKIDVAPFIENGRVFVPARYLDAIGIKMSWDRATSTVTLTEGNTIAKFVIGKKSMIVNGKEGAMGVAPILKNKRAFIPIRYVGEAFGCAVKWDQASHTVSI
ncbi:MAG: copper amine oxidase N-terminal domain-containing protein [Thermacetogeniaceae bacterium]